MAKSETVSNSTNEEITADHEAVLDEDLSTLEEIPEVSGLWMLTVIKATHRQGHSDKGPWSMISVMFAPEYPVGEDVDGVEINPEDYAPIYHSIFYNKIRDKHQFVAFAGILDVKPGKLTEMLSDLAGQHVVAMAKPGVDNRGQFETKLSGFRSADAFYA